MKLKGSMFSSALFVILLPLLCTSAGTAQEKAEKLGKVHFPISCSLAAQEEFNRAVALLHSFWFREAVKAFTHVTQTDPDCAMGYWGLAMSFLGPNPLYPTASAEALKNGWGAVEKANAVGPKTQRERDWITAIEPLFKDVETVDFRTRTLAFEKAMEQLYLRYPEDREAAVFYALALNMTALPTDKTYANQLKAAAILEKLFVEQPEHPGVAHYLIHTYDYPPLATRGLPAARRYASIAPAAPHALHMPSHIFTILGLWQESIQSNRAATPAATAVGESALHYMDFMVYAYLQGAQDLEAKRLIAEREAFRNVADQRLGHANAFAAIPARYALERRDWAEAAALMPRASRFAYSEAIIYFARAMGSARSGNVSKARKDIEKLEELRDALMQVKNQYWADQVEVQRLAASAWLAREEGRNEEAVKLMRAAADLEDSSEKHIAMENRLLPMRELLGELLVGLNQPARAMKEFEASLQVTPNRLRGFYAAAKAAEALGDREKARTYYAKLVAVCEKADTERPELQEARAFLARK